MELGYCHFCLSIDSDSVMFACSAQSTDLEALLLTAFCYRQPHQQDDCLVSGYLLVFASFWVSRNLEPGCLLYNMIYKHK